jgi:DtxR family Mn-dependent transcriptional regulator
MSSIFLFFFIKYVNVMINIECGERIIMRILKSSEDYLEAMLVLKKRHGYVRSVDIAAELGVTKPSVSYATKRLRENGYITMDNDGLITLTSAGMNIAKRIYDRHNVLTDFFIALGVDDKTADEDACKVEHEISEATFAAIQNYMKQLKN